MTTVRIALAVLALQLAACTPWSEVPTQPVPVADPVAEMKLLLDSRLFVPEFVEVTPEYIKETYDRAAHTRIWTTALVFSRVGTPRIVTKNGHYLVQVPSANEKHPYEYRPFPDDLATCQRFVNAFYALSHRAVPAGTSS